MGIERERFLGSGENRIRGAAFQNLRDAIDQSPGASHQVEVRKAIFEPDAIPLGQTATKADLELWVLRLELLKGPEEAIDLLFGLLPDATGVEQDEVGFLCRLRQLEPFLGQDAGDLLRVSLVGLTAKGDQLKLGHVSLSFPNALAPHTSQCSASPNPLAWPPTRTPLGGSPTTMPPAIMHLLSISVEVAAYPVTGGHLSEDRFLFVTPVKALGTARVEPTAGRDMDRTERIPLQDHPPPFGSGVRRWDRGQERLRIGMKRIPVELIALCELHDLPEVHDCYPVADVLHHPEIMGDEQIGEAQLLLEILEEIDHLSLDGDIEG